MIIQCDSCGKDFERRNAEVNRSRRLERKQYCDQACAGRESPPAKNPPRGYVPRRNIDEFSPFRSHFKRLKYRKKEITLTIEDLKRIWEEQNGTCPLTGWKLDLPPTTHWTKELCKPNSASLDRIDSSGIYSSDNVRWVSCMANFCKNKWTDEEVIEFAQAVVKQI